MSIYTSWHAPNEDHPHTCAIYELRGDQLRGEGIYEFSGNPCDCGQPDAPIVYKGSNVLPRMSDMRGGWVDIASIPAHITGSDDDVGWLEFLRFGVNGSTVVLDRRGVQLVWQQLGQWLAGGDG